MKGFKMNQEKQEVNNQSITNEATVTETQSGASQTENKSSNIMNVVNDVKTRARRPKVNDDATDYTTVKEVNEVADSLGGYFDDQQKAYGELKDLRENSGEDNIVLVSGIVEKAEEIEDALTWAHTTLESLISRKKALYSENKDHYLDYEFKVFSKPTLS
jgi:hypothetical protein|tara:strand:+ start:1202 stop:1681 length:480 start_codon:yes stop_codon:yes gene_type:complete